MMPNNREVIESFSDLLNREICQCVNQDIDFDEFQKYENILILQSAPLNILEEVISQVYFANPNVHLIILGQNICDNLSITFSDKEISIVKHDKAFDESDIGMIKGIIASYNTDAVLFFNNFVNSLDFSNVEQLMVAIEDDMPIYSYSYGQQELNRHKNIAYHLYGCVLYRDLLEWFNNMEG